VTRLERQGSDPSSLGLRRWRHVSNGKGLTPAAGVVEREPVAVDDLDAARPATNLVGAHARETLREHAPIGRFELDGSAGRECAVATHDADGEQAASVHEQRASSSLVDDQTPGRGFRVAEPELERSAAVYVPRSKASASRFPGDDRTEHVTT
jgi:hypothetical protein